MSCVRRAIYFLFYVWRYASFLSLSLSLLGILSHPDARRRCVVLVCFSEVHVHADANRYFRRPLTTNTMRSLNDGRAQESRNHREIKGIYLAPAPAKHCQFSVVTLCEKNRYYTDIPDSDPPREGTSLAKARAVGIALPDTPAGDGWAHDLGAIGTKVGVVTDANPNCARFRAPWCYVALGSPFPRF